MLKYFNKQFIWYKLPQHSAHCYYKAWFQFESSRYRML